MKRPSTRRVFEALEARIPARVREQVKRRYRRKRRARPLRWSVAQRDLRARTPHLRSLGQLCPLPLQLQPFRATSGRRGRLVDACLVAPGSLDPFLEELIACERHAVPLVCLTDHADEVDSEIAGIATALIVPSVSLAQRAARVVPGEFVAVCPTVIDTRTLPAAAFRSSPGTLVLAIADDRTDGELATLAPDHARVVQVDTATARAHLVERARGAIGLIAPRAAASPDAWRCAATLAACGVPVVGDTGPDHPLDQLVIATAANGLLSATPREALQTLAEDLHVARVAAIRSRRETLTQLSTSAFVRQLLDATRTPALQVSVTAIVRVDAVDEATDLWASLARQRFAPSEVLIVAPRDQLGVIQTAEPALSVPIRVLADGHRWLQRAVAASRGHFVAFLDGNAVYGPHHLVDLLSALESTGAPVVGHAAHYTFDPHDEHTSLVRGAEEASCDTLLPGSTLISRSKALRELRRARVRSEHDLHRRLRRGGNDLYAVHPFGFLRRGTPSANSLAVTDGSPWNLAFPDGDGGVPFSSPNPPQG